MFHKVPYLSTIFFMLFLCGISIAIVCVLKIANIFALFGYHMFKRNYLWLKDVKIFLISFYAYTIILMIYNLVIAYRSTAIVSLNRRSRIYCLDSSLVQKILLVINHLTLITVFGLSMIVTVIVFVFTTLKSLCTDGANVPKTLPLDPYKIGFNPGEIGQLLDLREFAPLIKLRSNETMYLYLQNDSLKTFCDDYVSILYVYNLIFFGASILLFYAMLNIVLTYSFNISRNVTKKKLQELIYLNGNELNELNPKN